MNHPIDVANDAHRVLQARSKILDNLKNELKETDKSIEYLDSFAKKNNGGLPDTAQPGKSPSELLIKKAAVEAAIAIAKDRVEQAKEDYEQKNKLISRNEN